MKKHIGKTAYVKFGNFHGQAGTIVGETHVNGHDRFLIKLKNGLTIPKKVKNVVIFKND
jgi:hypothetical protein